MWDKAKSLPGALFSQSGWEAAKDQYGNFLEGGKELVGMGNRERAMQDMKAQAERGRTDSDYNQASIFHGIANPTVAIGGPSTTIPKVMMAAGAQGMLRPNESWTGQIMEGAKDAAIAAPLAAATKLLPTTRTSVFGGQEALDKFPGFKPSGGQANPGTIEAAIASGAGVPEATALGQSKSITAQLLRDAGSSESRIGANTLSDAESALANKYESFIPKGTKVTLDPANRKELIDGIEAMIDTGSRLGKDSTIAQLYNVLTKGNVKAVSAEGFHEAWKEIGQIAKDPQAAGQLRDALRDLFSKGMSPAKLKEFEELNRQWGTLQDVKLIWGTGGGAGTASGTLKPSKIEALAKESPEGSNMRDALDLITKFGVHDPSGVKLPITSWEQALGRGAQATVGKAGNFLDTSALHAGKIPKYIIDMLRATPRASTAAFDLGE
jgi:hypothetical protein